jgi:uncharacterized membrane protein
MADQPEDLARLKVAIEDLTRRVQRLEESASNPTVGLLAASTPQKGLSVRIINRVGAFTVALGVIFFFKYALDENLIRAAFGVWLGVLFGILLLGFGHWLNKRNQSVFAQGITGCGLAVLYTSIYASFGLYHLVSAGLGFVGLLLASLAGIVLAIRYGNPAIAIIGFLGAAAAPLLLTAERAGTGSVNLLAHLFYFLVIGTAAVSLATRQNWTVLAPATTAPILFCATILFRGKNLNYVVVLGTALALLHLAASRIAKSDLVKKSLVVMAHCCLIVSGFCLVHIDIRPIAVAREVYSILLGTYGLALLAFGLQRKLAYLRNFGLVLLGLVIAKLYAVDLWSLGRGYRVTAFVGLGILLLVASYLYSRSDRTAASR